MVSKDILLGGKNCPSDLLFCQGKYIYFLIHAQERKIKGKVWLSFLLDVMGPLSYQAPIHAKMIELCDH